MIRVGFVLTFDAEGWLGGISYFRNLLDALASIPDPLVVPVILTGLRADPGVLAEFQSSEIVRSGILDIGSSSWMVRRTIAKLLNRDVHLEFLLRRHKIEVISHQGFFSGMGRIRVLGWIPDFQEHHLPQFFSAAELRARHRKHRLFCSVCSRIILSSNDAKRDLELMTLDCAARARVLRFVANVTAPSFAESAMVARRFSIETPYFHLPNQFWLHKNHAVVVEALRIVKSHGADAQVVTTGSTNDYRHPFQFEALMRHVQQAGVRDRFRVLGAVAYADLVALMAGSVAVINPSRFEGWSTTVEEAKSLGKQVLLSDIPVHREQCPPRGHFFMPDDAEGLASLMENVLSSYDLVTERNAMQSARARLPERVRSFGRAYQDIVLECLE